MLIISNIGDQVWLITSKQTDPDLSKGKMSQYSHSLQSNCLLSSCASSLHEFTACNSPGINSQLIDVGVEDAVDEADAR